MGFLISSVSLNRVGLIFLSVSFITTINAQQSNWRYTAENANIFSSPRFTDLNQDGVKDVVIGAGIEGKPVENGVIAIDGQTGKNIWSVPARTQVYTSALFQDITGDGVDDVFIGGRAAVYYAINGASGEIIWEFFKGTDDESRKAGLLNFFGTQWIGDYDNDGYNDLLVTNGGDYLAAPEDKTRATARLMIIGSSSGEILHSALLPEKRESYYAPHINNSNKKKPTIIFGTGGETIDGALWEIPLKKLAKGSLKCAKEILRDTTKGFILNSVLADINGDKELDILNARMNATLTAIDGANNDVIWEHSFTGLECYVTPSLGHFVGDSTLDFFTILAAGTFPNYTSFELIVIDGSTGEISWREKSGFNQFSPAVCADLNKDGNDEIIYIENELVNPETFEIINKVRVIDIKNANSYYVGPSRPGLSMASAPGLVDLDNNGTMEIIVVNSSISMGETPQFSIIERIDLNKEIQNITWPGYLGPYENGSSLK